MALVIECFKSCLNNGPFLFKAILFFPITNTHTHTHAHTPHATRTHTHMRVDTPHTHYTTLHVVIILSSFKVLVKFLPPPHPSLTLTRRVLAFLLLLFRATCIIYLISFVVNDVNFSRKVYGWWLIFMPRLFH